MGPGANKNDFIHWEGSKIFLTIKYYFVFEGLPEFSKSANRTFEFCRVVCTALVQDLLSCILCTAVLFFTT